MEIFAALLLAAETVFAVVCAARLRKDGQTGGAAAWVAGLCAGADLAFLLPRLLAAWLRPERPFLWLGLGELADAGLSTVAWLLLYLLWEKRFGGEIRDGWSFWTALGAALLRLLVCAASASALIRGELTRAWTLARLLPLCFLAAAVVTVWHSLPPTRPRLRLLWPLLMAALALRLVSVGLELPLSPILPRLPLLAVHVGLFRCLGEKAQRGGDL